jgi:hypothetical protein
MARPAYPVAVLEPIFCEFLNIGSRRCSVYAGDNQKRVCMRALFDCKVVSPYHDRFRATVCSRGPRASNAETAPVWDSTVLLATYGLSSL